MPEVSPVAVIVILVLGLMVSAVIFIALRELSCWYLRTNKCLKLLEDIVDLLKDQRKTLNRIAAAPEIPDGTEIPEEKA